MRGEATTKREAVDVQALTYSCPSETPRPKGGASQKPYKIVWGNLSPNPPKTDAIHPRAKHGALWHELVDEIIEYSINGKMISIGALKSLSISMQLL